MIKITVDFSDARVAHTEHNVSRVPCLGERLDIGHRVFGVHDVVHYIDRGENEPVALVRVGYVLRS